MKGNEVLYSVMLWNVIVSESRFSNLYSTRTHILGAPLRESHIDAIAAILQGQRQLAVEAANARLKVLKILSTSVIRQLLTPGKCQEQRTEQREKGEFGKTMGDHCALFGKFIAISNGN